MDQEQLEKQKKIIQKNLERTHHRIEQACEKSGRSSDEVQLMLVTKTVPLQHVQIALDEGENLLGENTSEELIRTSSEFSDAYQPKIHFIGHLHKNNLESVLLNVQCVQTVDRIELAREMNTKLHEMNQTMDVLIQVNTSRKESKYGISPEHAIGLVLKVAKLPNLRIRGLMTLGIFNGTEEQAKSCFQLLNNLYEEIRFLNLPKTQMEVLSMGMSDHLEAAILEGSTIVRVGTAIFGERDTPDSYYWSE